MSEHLLFLHYIRVVMSDVDGGLYAQVFQFAAVEALSVFVVERRDVVVVSAFNSAASIGHSQRVSRLKGRRILLL